MHFDDGDVAISLIQTLQSYNTNWFVKNDHHGATVCTVCGCLLFVDISTGHDDSCPAPQMLAFGTLVKDEWFTIR